MKNQEITVKIVQGTEDRQKGSAHARIKIYQGKKCVKTLKADLIKPVEDRDVSQQDYVRVSEE